MSKKRTKTIEIARQKLWESIARVSGAGLIGHWGKTWINHAFDAGVDAGIEEQPRENTLCRAALKKIGTLLGKDCLAPAAANIRKVIELALRDTEPPAPREPPSATLKDLREAAGLSLEYVCGVTLLGKVYKEWETGLYFTQSGLAIKAFVLLYKKDESAIRAAFKASREAAEGKEEKARVKTDSD